MLRSIAQKILFSTVRPYMWMELPGWGKLSGPLLNHEWIWQNTTRKQVRGKIHGFTMDVDLSNWSDRLTYFLGRWYDLEMQLFLQQMVSVGDTVVDIGANRGMFALTAAKLVGASGKVVCFEPNPSCCARLSSAVKANSLSRVHLSQMGLSDSAGELLLSIPKMTDGEATFGHSAYRGIDVDQVKCAVSTGDAELQNETPKLIKIDVEGFEFKVLIGLKSTKQRWRPIVITELISEHLHACGSSVSEVKNLMESLGYKGHRLSLSKSTGKPTLILCDLSDLSGECDIAWIP